MYKGTVLPSKTAIARRDNDGVTVKVCLAQAPVAGKYQCHTSIKDESFVMDDYSCAFALRNGGGKEVLNDDIFYYRIAGSSMEDVPTASRCDSRRRTEHDWCRRFGPQPLDERPRARIGSGNAGAAAAECYGMTGRTSDEAYSIDGYPTGTPTPQNRVFMELWQARCAQGYVAVHLHSKINLGDLAQATQFSRCKFNRTFKASFGCTPGQYVRRMRIARAQNLMTITRDPLCQIAAESGFADQSHFNRCFRQAVGESPAIWRARRRKSLQKTSEPMSTTCEDESPRITR
jgi:AraC-like DNA-binding protein